MQYLFGLSYFFTEYLVKERNSVPHKWAQDGKAIDDFVIHFKIGLIKAIAILLSGICMKVLFPIRVLYRLRRKISLWSLFKQIWLSFVL
jgi:hypothetical protein